MPQPPGSGNACAHAIVGASVPRGGGRRGGEGIGGPAGAVNAAHLRSSTSITNAFTSWSVSLSWLWRTFAATVRPLYCALYTDPLAPPPRRSPSSISTSKSMLMFGSSWSDVGEEGGTGAGEAAGGSSAAADRDTAASPAASTVTSSSSMSSSSSSLYPRAGPRPAPPEDSPASPSDGAAAGAATAACARSVPTELSPSLPTLSRRTSGSYDCVAASRYVLGRPETKLSRSADAGSFAK